MVRSARLFFYDALSPGGSALSRTRFTLENVGQVYLGVFRRRTRVSVYGVLNIPSRQDARQLKKTLRLNTALRPTVIKATMTLSMVMLMLTLAARPAAAGQCRWWVEPRVQGALTLTKSQVAAIEAEHSRTLNHRRLLREEFEAAHAELTRALERDDGSDAAIEAMVSRVEVLRQRRNVARTQLLVAMYFLLTPEQRIALPSLVRGDLLKVPLRC
jgi:Spy/CpxP family protein refolding chaperone